jgi:Protein tyrosine and serine/threonine kinase
LKRKKKSFCLHFFFDRKKKSSEKKEEKMSWGREERIPNDIYDGYYENEGSDSSDTSWTDTSEDSDGGMARELLVEQLEEYDPRIFNIDFGDLEDLKRIGGGNFGQVWKAMYFGTKVAVKQLLDIDDQDMHKYITREMLTLRDVRHPNVVQLMGLCKHASGIYIVTEFISGGNLRQTLKKKDLELPWALRVRVAIDIAMALHYLHSRGIIHRDLKSQSMLQKKKNNNNKSTKSTKEERKKS